MCLPESFRQHARDTAMRNLGNSRSRGGMLGMVLPMIQRARQQRAQQPAPSPTPMPSQPSMRGSWRNPYGGGS